MSRVRASEQQVKGKQIAQGIPAKVAGNRTSVNSLNGKKVSGYGSKSAKNKSY